jgi:hypothetical protein
VAKYNELEQIHNDDGAAGQEHDEHQQINSERGLNGRFALVDTEAFKTQT